MGLSTSEDAQCPQAVTSVDGADTSPPVNYYGVYLPKVGSTDDEGIGVFTDKSLALAEVKKNRNARFKSCKTFSEALSFSKQTVDQLNRSGSVNNSFEGSPNSPTSMSAASFVEKGTAFRAPKTQDYVKLRKAIENGDAEYVTKNVWSNPRYLISSGDTPSILQEGSRYNALHIAAKSKQSAICRIILDTIEDTKFMKLLYSDDAEDTTIQRTAFLVDLYLNMPDKASCETPLHFASKFGCLKILEMLTVYPNCDRTLKNKYGQTAKEIAGSRCPHNAELLRQIEDTFEDRYYIPVFSCENHSFQPYIGDPMSPSRKESAPTIVSLASSPVGASHVVRAIAGPMSPKQAHDMYKNWRTPPFLKCSTFSGSCPPQLGVKLSDTEKGLERIGRQLAEDNQLEWTERWSFLGEFCNLKKPEGLAKLETFLRNKYRSVMETNKNQTSLNNDDEILNGFMPSMEGSRWSICSDIDSPIGRLCSSFDRMNIQSSPEQTARSAKPIHNHRPTVLPPPAPNTNPAAPLVDQLTGTPPPAPPSPLQLATVQILDRLCRDVARIIANELKERVLNNSFGSRQDFVTRARSGLECLMRLVRDARRPAPWSGNETVDAAGVHGTIAALVVAALGDQSSFSEGVESDALASLVIRNGHALASSSSDEESSSEEDFSRWRGHPSTARDAAAVKRLVRRHMDCVLAHVGQVGQRPVQCTCEWNLEAFEVGRGVTKIQPASPPPQIQRLERSGGMVQAKWGQGAVERTPAGYCTDRSTPIRCTSANNKSHSAAGFTTLESGDDSSSVDSFFTPPSSYVSSASSSCGEVHTPEEDLAIFINGLEPTKCDVDVLRALENANIDPVLYPHITRWKYFVTSHTREEIESWPTPASMRRNTARRQSTNSNWHSSSPLLLGNKQHKSLTRDENLDQHDEMNFDIRKVQSKLINSIFSDNNESMSFIP